MRAMDDFEVPVTIPMDGDGFLRRECPSCEQEFKWHAHDDGDLDAEGVNQYFCPLCGTPSGPDNWWTPEQLEFARGSAGPAIEQALQDGMSGAFKGINGVSFRPNRDFTLDIPTPEPLIEPDDMVIVEPPCHPNEPIKVPEAVLARICCLICGAPFAA